MKAGKPTRFLRPLLVYWKETPVSQITAGAIRQAAMTLYPNATGATRNRAVITPAQAVINHAAEEHELCQRIRVKRFPTEKKEKRPATWNWVQEFMSNSSPHLGALACFMFLTGARISEALSLTWNVVDLGQSQAKINQTKTGSERRAHLPPVLISALANIPDRKGPVFGYSSRQSCDRSWRRACVRAGIEVLSFHSCRHGFATTALRAGIDVKTVARLGGWRSAAQVLSTYAHALDDLTLTDRLVDNESVDFQTQPRHIRPKVVGE
jgi:integrase